MTTEILTKELVTALESCKKLSSIKSVDIFCALDKWAEQEIVMDGRISIIDPYGEDACESMKYLYYHTGDANTHKYSWMIPMRLLLTNMGNGSISRVSLLDFMQSYWFSLKKFSESYDILIYLAETMQYYEDQVPNYLKIIDMLEAACN